MLKDEHKKDEILNDQSKTYLICCFLERLRGYNKAIKQILTIPRRIYELFNKMFHNLLVIQNVYANNENVIYLLLRLAAELVEVHILFLHVINLIYLLLNLTLVE